jgi:carbamoyl-phosphate synthase small subunit
MVVKWDPTEPSNWRAAGDLHDWLKKVGRIGIGGIDTRRLTRAIRQQGAPHVRWRMTPRAGSTSSGWWRRRAAWKGLVGLDLAKDVTCAQSYTLGRDPLGLARGLWPARRPGPASVVAIDYGAKRNILRCLASTGCE